jgi:hypothetical protein
MGLETLLTVFTTVVTALGLQRAGPMIVSAWARRMEKHRAERIEAERAATVQAVERERIDSSQLIEREKLVASREQEFHRIEASLREELKQDREALKEELATVNVELARQALHYRRCTRDRKRLHRRMRLLEERLLNTGGVAR